MTLKMWDIDKQSQIITIIISKRENNNKNACDVGLWDYSKNIIRCSFIVLSLL